MTARWRGSSRTARSWASTMPTTCPVTTKITCRVEVVPGPTQA